MTLRRCLGQFFHSWNPWQDQYADDGGPHPSPFQFRTCAVCNVLQKRYVP